MQKINFKLLAFPYVSETFVVSNILLAIKNGFDVCIYTDNYLGLKNSSQRLQLEKFNIESKVLYPMQPKIEYNTYTKAVKSIIALLNFRVLKFSFIYYWKYKYIDFRILMKLKFYSNFKSATTHIHFNPALEPLMKFVEIGFIKSKFLITFHGYDAFLETKDSFQSKYGNFYKNVYCVTCNSNYLKEQILKLGIQKEKIKIIPMGIDSSKFKGRSKCIKNKTPIKLITVGRLIQLKGQIYGIQACNELVKKGYDCTYLIVGSGGEQRKLEQEVIRLNLNNRISFTGDLQQDEIKQKLEESHLFIMPSTYDNETKRREAFGLTSIEAQSMGLPVIGFNSGGFVDTIKEGITGFAVEDRNVSKMVKRIEELIKNKETYKKMSLNCIQHAKKFDLKFTMQKFIELYKETA